ncbi:MAG: 16S rRNA (cytosine(967)-C(5))-methyltransferase RsmB [Gammaproteobacteria bacterium]|nr:16S rRNA (cytosine(967)-C(5))-methyltransferase RsmB [Gammaproteobacteria bacterium]
MSGGGGRPEPGAASRALAARAVAAVLGAGATLDAALDAALAAPDAGALSAVDRSQVRALAYGALRWHHRHRRLLGLLLDRPLSAQDHLLEALLSVGLFQLLDARQPEYAAVSATVAAARWLGKPRWAGVVNASLRRLQRERAALMATVLADEEARHSHPAWLIARLQRDWPQAWEGILQAGQEAPPLWLRVNQARLTTQACLDQLEAAGVPAAAGPVPGALRLERALPVSDIPGFAAGDLSVQDAASQLAAPLLGARPGMRVLDACAAPGGKAGHVLEQARGPLDLLALDVDATRLERVRENLLRLGLAATLQVADATAPAHWWDGRPFDRILLDAPCSGTGVIRRHPDIKWLRRASDIAPLARRQAALLRALWPLLRPGGQLLYATCSILHEENDAVITTFLADHADAVAAAPPREALPGWLRSVAGAGWQALPGDAGTDGLYYALMARTSA